MNPETNTFKCIIVGNRKVGKSAYLERIRTNNFSEKYTPSNGVDILAKQFHTDKGPVNIQFWDISSDSWVPFFSTSVRDAKACIIMFDLSNQESYNNVSRWVKDVNTFAPDIPTVVIGNKNDSPKFCNIGPELYSNFPVGTFQISVKNGTFILDPIRTLLKSLGYTYTGMVSENLVPGGGSCPDNVPPASLFVCGGTGGPPSLQDTFGNCPGYSVRSGSIFGTPPQQPLYDQYTGRPLQLMFDPYTGQRLPQFPVYPPTYPFPQPAPFMPPQPVPQPSEAVHIEIQCDGCKRNPIVGPRYKSRVQTDYDLCGDCYNKANVFLQAEYILISSPMEKPFSYGAPKASLGPGNFFNVPPEAYASQSQIQQR